jgi:hypothetical protein
LLVGKEVSGFEGGYMFDDRRSADRCARQATALEMPPHIPPDEFRIEETSAGYRYLINCSRLIAQGASWRSC